MKRSIAFLLSLLLLNSFLCKGQIDTKNLSIGIVLSPDYCNLKVKGSDTRYIDAFNNLKSSKMGFTGGVVILNKMSEFVALEYGLFYSNKGFALNFKPNVTDPRYPAGSLIETRYDFHYLDVPLKLNLYLMKKDIKLFVSGGFSGNVLLDAKEITWSYNQRNVSGNNVFYKPFGLSMLASIGLDFPVSQKASIRVEPIYRRSITRVNVDGDEKWYLYSASLNLGLYFKL